MWSHIYLLTDKCIRFSDKFRWLKVGRKCIYKNLLLSLYSPHPICWITNCEGWLICLRYHYLTTIFRLFFFFFFPTIKQKLPNCTIQLRSFVLMHFVPHTRPKSLSFVHPVCSCCKSSNSKAILYAVQSDFLHDSVPKEADPWVSMNKHEYACILLRCGV